MGDPKPGVFHLEMVATSPCFHAYQHGCCTRASCPWPQKTASRAPPPSTLRGRKHHILPAAFFIAGHDAITFSVGLSKSNALTFQAIEAKSLELLEGDFLKRRVPIQLESIWILPDVHLGHTSADSSPLHLLHIGCFPRAAEGKTCLCTLRFSFHKI